MKMRIILHIKDLLKKNLDEIKNIQYNISLNKRDIFHEVDDLNESLYISLNTM